MSFFLKLFYWVIKYPNLKKIKRYSSNLKFGDFCNFSFYPSLGDIQLGDGVSIRNYCNILVGNEAQLIIGDNVFMNNYCSINCLDRIEIGNNTLFGEGVKLYDHNHQYTSEKIERYIFNKGGIKIGENCWLGSNVVVLKGVTIGDNTIVGAGCTIYKDIPANSIVINKQELISKSKSKWDINTHYN
ncbi:acyltransferase [Riemerella anatipestifer]|nr:acyltransferase [Riemerella anatipestifer]